MAQNQPSAAELQTQIGQACDTIGCLKRRIALGRAADLARQLEEQQAVVAEWRRLVPGKLSDDGTPSPGDLHRPIGRQIPGEQGLALAEAKLAAIQGQIAEFDQRVRDLAAEEQRLQTLRSSLAQSNAPPKPGDQPDAPEA